ncbi:hypothetical protein QE152_g41046 [Popillia japonica]|uniref:Reverse transcriptase zinc-binding domain-containing protein n=1 Tax=Popillia japonica TaxID=7064 RepID=A0AAW1H1K0_POPJA
MDKGITPLNLRNKEYNPRKSILSDAEKMEKWRAKERHGRYIYTLSQNHIDAKASCQWLCSGNIFPETEGFMIAMQDQVVATLNHKKYIIKENIESSKCRVCLKQNETVEHILSGCSPLAPHEYTDTTTLPR